MIQVPVPPVPPLPPMPDIGNVFMTGDDIAKIVVFSMMGLAVITWLIVRGPIGAAIGAAIRKVAGVEAPSAALPGEVDALRTELDSMKVHLNELAERVDFGERMLAQVRRERQLPGTTDVAG